MAKKQAPKATDGIGKRLGVVACVIGAFIMISIPIGFIGVLLAGAFVAGAFILARS